MTGAEPVITEVAACVDLAGVVEQIGRAAFDRNLLRWLAGQVAFDSALILLYAEQQRPRILVDAFDNPDRRNNAELYVGAAYLLDPFYLHARRCAQPCLIRLGDIVPEDFARSDYVETYYRRSAIRDEVNYLVPLGQVTYAICIERSIREPQFSRDDLKRLDLLLPLLTALVRRHGELAGTELRQTTPDSEHLRLQKVLADFGQDVLTPREREVVGLMLTGYALAQISAELEISPETVRVHRRNIYDKLAIGSLAELFSRALAELAASR